MIKIISCRLFETYIKQEINENVDIVYLDVNMHLYPKRLAALIQQEIDQSKDYESILILYGLCGNMLLELKARDIPLYIIPVHDCLGILLGGHKKYLDYFSSRPSCSWTCKGLLENKISSNLNNYQEWVELYGQEEADYLKEMLCPTCSIYISIDQEKVDYPEVIEGNKDYLKQILKQTNKSLLVLNKNEKLKLTNDEKVIEVIRNQV